MPERSFGRTVRYRRNKLGLSQTKLAELVGRSPNTIRSWERDKSVPNDTKVLTALSAILGVDERTLFEKVGQSVPEEEASPTIEQALATLDPELVDGTTFGGEKGEAANFGEVDAEVATAVQDEDTEAGAEDEARLSIDIREVQEPAPESTLQPQSTASFAAPPTSYVVKPASPPAHEPSYMEDSSQRQLYRVRNLATIVVLVALVVALIWAIGESFGALSDWWDEFFGNLRL